MAMGLAFGRGRVSRKIFIAVLHVAGAVLGGAIVGGLLGGLGELLSLSVWRPELIIAVVLFALWQSLSHRPAKLGLRRQVPRTWVRTMAPEPRFFLWGVSLGCGVATLIPYSAFLVILVVQLTSGVALGFLSGALFGGMRGAVMLLPVLGRQNRLHPEELPRFLPSLATTVQRINLLWLLLGGPLLLITSWH